MASEALAAQDYAQAMTYADRARVANMSERRAGEAELGALLEQIDKIAAELLASADAKLDANDLTGAYAIYEQVKQAFPTLDAGKQASARMSEIRSKGATVLAEIEFKSLMDMIGEAWKAKNAGTAEGRVKVDAVEVIMEMDPEQQRLAVQKILILAQRYGATPYGEKASALLEKLKAAHAERQAEADKDVAAL